MTTSLSLPIPGYEGLYEIYDDGRILSYNYGNSGTSKFISTRKYKNTELLRVTLTKNGKPQTHFVHILVAKTFIPNYDCLVIVKHEDGNVENNHVSNLNWCRKYKTTKTRLPEAYVDGETFTDIKGFEGKYMISDAGNLLSVNYNNTNNARLCANNVNMNGYVENCLYLNNKRTYFTRHRLVASHFIENYNGMEIVNHIDGNKLNNHFSNLEWCDIDYNNKHAYDTGLLKPSSNTLRKLTLDKVEHIRELLKTDIFVTDIAKMFNVSRDAIDDIKFGKTWNK